MIRSFKGECETVKGNGCDPHNSSQGGSIYRYRLLFVIIWWLGSPNFAVLLVGPPSFPRESLISSSEHPAPEKPSLLLVLLISILASSILFPAKSPVFHSENREHPWKSPNFFIPGPKQCACCRVFTTSKGLLAVAAAQPATKPESRSYTPHSCGESCRKGRV